MIESDIKHKPKSKELKRKTLSKKNKLLRFIWNIVWLFFYRPSPTPLHAWRCFLLSLFGAKIGKKVHPYPSSKIWAPWNLTMGDFSCLSHHVDCYCVDKVTIGSRATVSQYSFICTASHDYTKPTMPLVTAPIKIGAYAWVTSGVFIAPGINIGKGAVVTARSVVVKNVNSWEVVGGHPATFIKMRKHEDS